MLCGIFFLSTIMLLKKVVQVMMVSHVVVNGDFLFHHLFFLEYLFFFSLCCKLTICPFCVTLFLSYTGRTWRSCDVNEQHSNQGPQWPRGGDQENQQPLVVFLIIGTSAISNNDDQLTRQLLNRSSLVERTTWRPRVIQREGGWPGEGGRVFERGNEGEWGGRNLASTHW